MRCPKCGVKTLEKSCPKCGEALERASSTQHPSQPAITFTVTSKPSSDPASSDWRAELRRKLRQHHRKKGSTPQPRQDLSQTRVRPRVPEVKAKPPEHKSEKDDGDAGIFDYKLKEEAVESKRSDTVVPIKPAAESPPAKKPLAKPTPRPQTEVDKRQARLRLETPTRRAPKRENTPRTPTPIPITRREPDTILSSEIIFTRVLSWLIDAILYASVGGLFGLAAANLVGAVFLTPEWLRLSGVFAVGLYLLSTVFFLYTTRQTPGMMWTDLILESDEVDEPPELIAVLIRTILFPTLAVTGIGLLWALFDKRKRCWHDHLSNTWVAPLLTDPSSRPRVPAGNR